MDSDVKQFLYREQLNGERHGNYLRLGIVGFLLATFAVFYLKSREHYTAGYIILATFLGLLFYSLVLWRMLRNGRYHPLMKYTSFAIDLTSVSIVAGASLFLSSGPQAASWLASSTVYFLFIALTAIRLSPRLCGLMGMAAAIEFTLVNQFAQSIGGLGLPLAQQASVGAVMVITGLVLAVSAGTAQRLMLRMVQAERERIHVESAAELSRRQAITDELTGIPNRRHFHGELRRCLAIASAQDRPYSFSVLSIDLDGFKDVNDTLGHYAGDSILSQVALVLSHSVRSKDVAARVGGDEFGVLLPDIDASGAQEVAERLTKAITNHQFELDGAAVAIRLSLSVGVASFPTDGRGLDELLRAADKALYLAKSLGKDRVVLAGSR